MDRGNGVVVERDLHEAGGTQAGRVAQSGAPAFRQTSEGMSLGTNAQAAWTCPQQYRWGPIPESQRATSEAFFIRLSDNSLA